MDNILMVFECLGRQRVQLATYLFHSVADDWWRTVQSPYEMLTNDITWTVFRTDFLNKFILVHIKD